MHCPFPTASAMAARSSIGLAHENSAEEEEAGDRGHAYGFTAGQHAIAIGNSPLFFDRAAENAEVLAKCVVRIGRTFGEIIGEAQLRAESLAGVDRVRLAAFALPD